MADDALVELVGVRKHYSVRGPRAGRHVQLRAVDGVDLDVRPGRSVGIVGESGCGKSTTARLLLLLEPPTEGRVLFRGSEVTGRGAGARRYRASVQPVFQDPFSSLSPRLRVGAIVGEPLRALLRMRGTELQARVVDALALVGLEPAAAERYPHQFSGGQRQRIALARALAPRPHLVVLDEPVSALDVSIRAQILNLLRDLQDDLGLTYLLISHDLPTLRYLVSEVVVMYLGKIVERGPAETLFEHPRHPYTHALLSAIPEIDGAAITVPEVLVEGDVPSAIDPPSGCRFRTRCPVAMDVCASIEPVLQDDGRGAVACHLVNEPVAVR